MANFMDPEGQRSSAIIPKPPSNKVVKQPRSKVVVSKPRTSSASRRRTSSVRRSSSSRNYRSSAVQRRATSSSKPRSVARSTPVAPKPPAKIIKPVAPPKPAAPSNATFLRSDSTYQRQMAAYAKALVDYQADQGLQRTDYDTTYGNTKRDIGLAKTDALGDLENDYAARGLLRSSLYNTDVGKLNQEYQNQYTDLDKQRTSFLDQLTQGLTGFKNEQSVQQQNAQAEALRRRAEKYNL